MSARVTRLIFYYCFMLSIINVDITASLNGTLLITDTCGNSAWNRGRILIKDLFSGETDTLIDDKACTGPIFSPDGKEILYSKSGSLFIYNIFKKTTAEIKGYSSDQLTWNADGNIYFPHGKWICKYNLGTGKFDSLHKLVGPPLVDREGLNWSITEGNVSADGTRACFINTIYCNHVIDADLNDHSEFNHSPTNCTCQGGISLDGTTCSVGEGFHTYVTLEPFHSSNVKHYIRAPCFSAISMTKKPLWMNRFSRSSSHLLIFHNAVEKNAFLFDMRTNRYRHIANNVCVWDIYSHGWVFDTIPPNPPTNLSVTNVTENSIHLSWAGASSHRDGDMPEFYLLERGTDTIAFLPATTTEFLDKGLSENTNYSYRIYSKDRGVSRSAPLSLDVKTLSDNIAPSIRNVYSFNDTSASILFSEEIDSVWASGASQFTISMGARVVSAVKKSPNIVSILTEPFQPHPQPNMVVSSATDASKARNVAQQQQTKKIVCVRNTVMLKDPARPVKRDSLWSFLEPGVEMWSKRRYPSGPVFFTSIPEKYRGLPCLIGLYDDYSVSDTAEYIRFEVNQPVRVHILTNSFVEEQNPSWLRNNWLLTNDTIQQALVYTRDFPMGTVTLKGNSPTIYDIFTILLQPIDSMEITNEEFIPNSSKETLIIFAYPQPFTKQIRLTLSTTVSAAVNLSIYGVNGVKIKSIKQGLLGAGKHEWWWNGIDETGNSVPVGVYILKLVSSQGEKSIKLLKMR